MTCKPSTSSPVPAAMNRRSASAKNRCTEDWRLSQSESKRTKIDDEKLRRLYEGGMTQIEVAAALCVTRKVVENAMRRLSIAPRKAIKRNQYGEKNVSWRGENATLSKKHRRLDRLYGTPSKCGVCGTSDSSKTYEWANLTGNYDDVKDFKRMCRSCHATYDKKYKNFKGQKGGPGKRGTRAIHE